MQAALITGKGQVSLETIGEPEPVPEGVVVDIELCGICGTDLHAYTSGDPYNPAICGHEWTGIISAVGSGVQTPPGHQHLEEGDRVVVAVPPPCGTCPACRSGQADRCQHAFLVSVGMDPLAPTHGGFAPRIAVGANRVVPVHPDLSVTEAAQVEPATVAFHAVRRTQPRLGDLAVIQGAGPIGLTVMQWVRVAGGGQVVVVEPNESRRALASKLGADLTVTPEDAAALIEEHSRGLGADVVYECVGNPATIQSAVDLARRGGIVSLIGFTHEPATVSPASWLVKEVTLQASLAYGHEDFQLAMRMIAAGRIDLDSLHSRTIGLDGLASALDDLAGGGSDMKVLVDPNL